MTEIGDLPAEIRITKFAEARINEIKHLEGILKTPRQGSLPFQQVPKHMRRRAVSHNPKRLPISLRKRHCAERTKSNPSGNSSAKKRPSRKFRRRPSNLLSDYNRRQKSAKWLETHIWHAKRFHMTPISEPKNDVKDFSGFFNEKSRWGYKLPDHPNDKGFRACYRYSLNNCLMQDISYYCCVELNGTLKTLLDGLDVISGPETKLGTGFNSPDALMGKCEGSAWLYHSNRYPFKAVGKVHFLWRPQETGSDTRTLWIFSHPSFYPEVLQIIRESFDLVEEIPSPDLDSNLESNGQPHEKKLKLDYSDSILAAKMEPKCLDSIPVLKGRNGVTATLLKDSLNRFRLTGPTSAAILKEVLIPSTLKGSESDPKWWSSHYNQEREEKDEEFWLKFSQYHINGTPAGQVVGLVVRDPRKLLPQKRRLLQAEQQVQPQENAVQYFNAAPNDSFLWDENVRKSVTSSKMPDRFINEMRSKLLGSQVLPLTTDESRVPILLVHQPGSKDHKGFGEGWDLIVPAGWAMSFWLPLVYNGARVCGLKENRQLNLEMGKLGPLDDAPDSLLGEAENKREKCLLTSSYLRHPPDKRPNYSRLGSATPFECPWSVLVKDWTKEFVPNKKEEPASCSEFFVLRELDMISNLNQVLYEMSNGTISKIEVNGSYEKAIVQVRVEIIGKGTLSPKSMICLPSLFDVKQYHDYLEDKSKNSEEGLKGPVEPLQIDENYDARKARRILRKKEKKMLGMKCKELRKTLAELRLQKTSLLAQGSSNPEKFQEISNTMKQTSERLKILMEKRSVLRSDFNKDMKDLWLDDINPVVSEEKKDFVATVKNSSSKEILGYIQFGGISYKRSRQLGLGYVTMVGIRQLFEFYETCLSNHRVHVPLVLVREPHNLQYTYAKISIDGYKNNK